MDQVKTQIFSISRDITKQIDNSLGSSNNQESEITKPNSFQVQFRFNLSENITQVRVSQRKSWISTIAEIMAYLAGLSFWAKLMKYILSVNHIGRYYDRRYKMYVYEDNSRASGVILERPSIENRDLITNDQMKLAVRDTRSKKNSDPLTNLELTYKWS